MPRASASRTHACASRIDCAVGRAVEQQARLDRVGVDDLQQRAVALAGTDAGQQPVADALARRGRRAQRGAHLREQRVDQLVVEREQQLLLAGKVLVQRRARHARELRHPGQPRVAKALRHEDLGPRREQPAAHTARGLPRAIHAALRCPLRFTRTLLTINVRCVSVPLTWTTPTAGP
jgi:hypothetical protein